MVVNSKVVFKKLLRHQPGTQKWCAHVPGWWRTLWRSNFKNLMKTVLFPNKNLLKSHYKRIFVCSASLPKERKVILNAIFDFTYREFKKIVFADHFQKWI